MSPTVDLQDLEDLLLQFGREELKAERALKQIQLQIRQLSSSGDDAAADEAEMRFERIRDALVGIRERIYRLETQLYSLRRRRQH